MNLEWQNDLQRINKNALSVDWFVSPLEYSWPDGKNLFDKMFHTTSNPNPGFDELFSPSIYKTSTNIPFRAKMMVFAYMRQDISKLYGLEIENGLMHLYRLDFASCISQWIYVIEGYCRKLFVTKSLKSIQPKKWTIPVSGNEINDSLIQILSTSLSDYLSKVMFKGTNDFSTVKLSRHLLLHGNIQNKNFYSQKNCLILLFILDSLVVIEMAKNTVYPLLFNENEGDIEAIERRICVYQNLLNSVFSDDNLLRIEMMKDHL